MFMRSLTVRRRRLGGQLSAGVTGHFGGAARDWQAGLTRSHNGHNNQRWRHGSPLHPARATEHGPARQHNQLHVCCFPITYSTFLILSAPGPAAVSSQGEQHRPTQSIMYFGEWWFAECKCLSVLFGHCLVDLHPY